jgi:isopentenyl-diphosphate delta-isomerase
LKTENQNRIVSFENELLILVDDNDREIGYDSKNNCHSGNGLLHRAFSIFIFNEQGHILMQQRSAQKKLWPQFWSNSCCSHPRKGEKLEDATIRRLEEELGFQTMLKFLFKFQYQAPYLQVGSENEFCSVYIGKSNDPLKTNPHEIEDYKFFSVEDLDGKVKENHHQFTPWFKMEWERMRNEFWEYILKYLNHTP